MTTKIETFLQKKAELKELLSKEGKNALVESFQAVFAAVPELETIEWTQYTPHFNDGEPCEFGVHEFNATFNVPVNDRVHKGYDGPGRYDNPRYQIEPRQPGEVFEEIGYGGYGNHTEDPILIRTREAIKPLQALKNSCEEVFQAAFGDGYKVHATRNGFDTEYYDHD